MAIQQRERAYQHIRDSVISGKYRRGARLSHRALAEEIGTSFIPVREALSQLASEGLITHRPGLGSFVAEVNRQELAELYDVREAIEGHAAENAAATITEEQLRELDAIHAELVAVVNEYSDGASGEWTAERSDRCAQNDAAFHLLLLRAAGNRRAIKVVNDLHLMTRIFGHRNEGRPLGDLRHMCEYHGAIVDALRRRDGAAARRLIIEHIRVGCQTALRAFDEHRLNMDATQDSSLSFPNDLQERLQDLEDST
jgi:DNA-binding GntR family transcriptional regulator